MRTFIYVIFYLSLATILVRAGSLMRNKYPRRGETPAWVDVLALFLQLALFIWGGYLLLIK